MLLSTVFMNINAIYSNLWDEGLKGYIGLPWWLSAKESTCRRPRFILWVGKIPWKKAWQPTPILLPGESHGQRSLEGYSPRGRTESDMTEASKQHMDSSLFHFFIQDQKWGGIMCIISYFYVFFSYFKFEPYFELSFMKKVYKTKFTAHVCL